MIILCFNKGKDFFELKNYVNRKKKKKLKIFYHKTTVNTTRN